MPSLITTITFFLNEFVVFMEWCFGSLTKKRIRRLVSLFLDNNSKGKNIMGSFHQKMEVMLDGQLISSNFLIFLIFVIWNVPGLSGAIIGLIIVGQN